MARTREQSAAAMAKWKRENPHGVRLNSWKQQGIKLTWDQYLLLLEVQDGRCAACGELVTDRSPVDHDHATGRVRGILCSPCNLAAGHLDESPAKAVKLAVYLRRHKL